MSAIVCWALIDKQGRLASAHQTRGAAEMELRNWHPGILTMREAILTIPEEPEWTVFIGKGGEYYVVPLAAMQGKSVRAPDAQTALARALEQRGPT